jgi:hypothetical protein
VRRRRAAAGQADAGSIVLGPDPERLKVTLNAHQLSAHSLILGATGSGQVDHYAADSA